MNEYKLEFDRMAPNWREDFQFNMLFLQSQENYLNHLLQARGHVFLNEVYDAIGYPRTTEGCLVGWLIDGDGVSFDLPTNQVEGSITLTFNVQGMIFHRIENL